MGKIKDAISNWYSGQFKNIHQAAKAAGCKSSAPVYRAIDQLENNVRVCPCCEQLLDSRLDFPKERFRLVDEYLTRLETEARKD